MPAAQTRTDGADQVHVNGRFLVQPVSGVQRYARELLSALDARLAASGAHGTAPVPVWYPGRAVPVAPPDWQVLRPMPLPGLSGYPWEQITLGHRIRHGILLSLCGSGPLLCRRQFLVIHDANIWTLPRSFPARYRAYHKALRPMLARRVTHPATVSHSAARTLAPYLGVPETRLTVIPNSAEHIRTHAPDMTILTRHNLTPGDYFLTVGNQSPNKNIARLAAALAQLDDPVPPLAIAGGTAPGLTETTQARAAHLRPLGRVSDAELAALYTHARAFLWPSLSEGFGIPPLEAMTLGTPVVSSDRTAMPEVLGDAALYFDPRDVAGIATALRRMRDLSADARALMIRRGHARAHHYRWSDSADMLLDAVDDLRRGT